MKLRTKAAILLGSVAVTGAVLAPGSAVADAPSRASAVAAGQIEAAASTTTSTGGYLRTSPYGSASAIVWTYSGETLTVYGSTYNSYGNKWYDVVDSAGYSGWIYCGNVTAGC